MDAYCTLCRELWQQYTAALLKHVRLKNSSRPARNLDETFKREVEAAERTRNELQETIRRHERDGHGVMAAVTGGGMGKPPTDKVQTAAAATKQILELLQSAARRMERLEADTSTNSHCVLVDPQEIAVYCRAVAGDLTNAANLISATSGQWTTIITIARAASIYRPRAFLINPRFRLKRASKVDGGHRDRRPFGNHIFSGHSLSQRKFCRSIRLRPSLCTTE